MDSAKKFIKKYCYITMPVIALVIIIILYLNMFTDVNFNVDTVIQINATLIGFLLTAITIFFSLPKDKDVMKRIKKYGHHIIYGRCVALGIIFLTISIIIWLISVPNQYVILLFLLGLTETLMAAYYMYKLAIYNFV